LPFGRFSPCYSFFNPLPFFPDSILTCKSDTLLKTPQPGRWAEFIWNTPDTFWFDPILQISKSGIYRLRSLDTEFNCPALVDTFYVGLNRERESVLAVNGKPEFRNSLVFSFPQNLTFSLTEKNAQDVQWRINETEFEPGAISKLVIATSEGVYEQEAKYFIGPCLTRAKGKIKLSLDSKDLSIPNLLTLNGDGINDMFVIQNLEKYAQSNLQVFNRWGKKVFEASPYLNNWKPDQEGNYFFILSLEGKTFSGWLLGNDKR
jgi:gliding motility-associated-like protein